MCSVSLYYRSADDTVMNTAQLIDITILHSATNENSDCVLTISSAVSYPKLWDSFFVLEDP